jgi:ribosomal protein S18 acetylase RimI-like enzyme
MGRPPPIIRLARPEDANFIARNILAAQRGPRPRGWFDITLDLPEPQCLAFVERLATAPQRSWWHVLHFIIAEVEGVPAAALCALPASGTLVAARAAIATVAGERGLGESELTEISRRGAYAANCWVQGEEGDWLLEHVATLPAYQGRGLVQALIENALRPARPRVFRGPRSRS